MAGLRVFVSSTCYDFSLLRSQLRLFIQSLGYEPIMSDYEDILYDPRIHTHTSCVDEVANCDMLVLIIGSRFGGKATSEALEKIDFERLRKEEKKVEQLKAEGKLSVTQLEVLKAVENEIPVYTFIDKKVWHDHSLYEKNKNSEIISQIIFPSIEKQETAKYIFEFINFVRLRTRGNNIFTFEKGIDIEEILKKQWSAYFQRLLYEQRYNREEQKKMEMLTNQFEDLKTAILSSIENLDQREIARGIVRFRRLFDFVLGLKHVGQDYLKETEDSWEQLLEKAGIVEIIDPREIFVENPMRYRVRLFLVCKDRFFYEFRFNKDYLEELRNEWKAFLTLSSKSREIIIEALREMNRGMSLIRYVREPFEKVCAGWKSKSYRQLELEESLDTDETL